MATNMKNHDEEINGSKNTSNWMSELSEDLQTLPMNKLAIPGSHNSCTFGIQATSACAPDAPDGIKASMSIPVLGDGIRAMCCAWSVCQRMDLVQQLQAGVRYFDLRIATKKGCEDYYIVHALYGPKITEMLEAITTFLQHHIKEVVLLDLNHFYSMDEENHVILLSIIISHFGDLLMPCADLNEVTLKYMWEHKKQVILFYHNSVAENFSEVWTSASITSPWPNTPKGEKCLSYLTQHLSQEQPNKYVVCQGILTPETSNIMKGGSLEKMVLKFNPSLCSWITEFSVQRPQALNIVIADFVGETGVIQRILRLNKARVCLK